ncbi:MAG TPA: hypothetical protein PKE16_01870 [Hyphomicrobium sp.]|nr:hypothetical protein [Hyphomicrobium sp.]
MRVFVLSTGRCGSTTFARACEHLTNYTSGHETRARMKGHERLNYPDNHIECDNRLSWLLGRLDERFGDDAYYVHLYRDPERVAKSYNRRWKKRESIVRAYRNGIHMSADAPNSEEWVLEFIDTVTKNIEFFLANKSRVMTMRMEDADQQFPKFLEWIGAEGDLDAAANEWTVRHNASRKKRWRNLLKFDGWRKPSPERQA